MNDHLEVPPPRPSTVGRVLAALKHWDQAVHADPVDYLAERVRRLEKRLAAVEGRLGAAE